MTFSFASIGCICLENAALICNRAQYCMMFVLFARNDQAESTSTEIKIRQLINLIQSNDKNGVILWLKTNNPSKLQVFICMSPSVTLECALCDLVCHVT